MKTIKIPDFAYHWILGALYETAVADRESGWDALGKRNHSTADEIKALNGDNEDDLKGEGATCYCDQRDDDEIALYLKANELRAIEWALGRVTFGDLEDKPSDAGNVMSVHRAICEVQDKILDTE